MTLADMIEMDINIFAKGIPLVDTNISPVLCFPAAPDTLICKCIRYLAGFCGLTAVYVGPREHMRMCVLQRKMLKPELQEKFNEMFQYQDEDTEILSIRSLYIKKMDNINIHNKKSQQRKNVAEIPVNPLLQSSEDPKSAISEPLQRPNSFEVSLSSPGFKKPDIYYPNVHYMLPAHYVLPNIEAPIGNQNDMNFNRAIGTNISAGKPHSVPNRAQFNVAKNYPEDDTNIPTHLAYCDTAYGDYMKPTSSMEQIHYENQEYTALGVDEINAILNECYPGGAWSANANSDLSDKNTLIDTPEYEIQTAHNIVNTYEEYSNSYFNGINQRNFPRFGSKYISNIPIAWNLYGFPAANRDETIYVDEEYIYAVQQLVQNPLILASKLDYIPTMSNVVALMECIIELSDFPQWFESQQLLDIYEERPRYIIWCDDTHALLVMASNNQVLQALSILHPSVKSRPLSRASQIATITLCKTNMDSPESVKLKKYANVWGIGSKPCVFINHVSQKPVILDSVFDMIRKMDPHTVCNLTLMDCNITEIYGMEHLVNLIELNLSCNRISVISGLDHLVSLKILILSQNRIATIKNLSKLTTLDVLEINQNILRKMENLESLVNLRVLELKGNNIKEINNLNSLKKLVKLNLSLNTIKELKNLEDNISLQYLDVAFNSIYTVTNIGQLTNLKVVNLNSNSIADWLELGVFAKLPQTFILRCLQNPLSQNTYFCKLLQNVLDSFNTL